MVKESAWSALWLLLTASKICAVVRWCQVTPGVISAAPNLRQVVYVTQGSEDEPEKTYSFIEEPSYVTGTFKISLPESDHEGKTRGFVYSIENATVVPFEGEALSGHLGTRTLPTTTLGREILHFLRLLQKSWFAKCAKS